MNTLIGEVRHPLCHGNKFMNGSSRNLSGSAPKSLHVVGFAKTKSPACASIKQLRGVPACHVNIIAMELFESVLAGIGAMPRYLLPLAKVRWRTFEQPRSTDNPRRSRDWWQKWLLLMVLAQNISHAVPTTPSAPHAGTAKGCPSPSCPSPQRGPHFSTLSFTDFCGQARCSALPLYI